jgi:hypothetical protein
MIEAQANPVEWALLLLELDEARDHLATLAAQMVSDGSIDETDYRIQLGHVYSHLNRAWNGRDNKSEPDQGLWKKQTRFPVDIDPV